MNVRSLIFSTVILSIFLLNFSNFQTKENSKQTVLSNGVLVKQPEVTNDDTIFSSNGVYKAVFRIGKVTDEYRELHDFALYQNGSLLYRIQDVPGSDMKISNSGYTVFFKMEKHFEHETGIEIYSKSGVQIYSNSWNNAFLFEFSKKGGLFGVGNHEKLDVIKLNDGQIISLEKALKVEFTQEEDKIALASEGRLKLYGISGNLLHEINTGLAYTRGLDFSPDGSSVGLTGRKKMQAYSIHDGSLLFSDELTGRETFRDLDFEGNVLNAGINLKENNNSYGILRQYDMSGKKLFHKIISETQFPERSTAFTKTTATYINGYKQLNWPFKPFDQIPTIWNYYEQHMGQGNLESYLHQGLDIIVPTGEPVYAVDDGVVKCVLTLGGARYWRTAVSEVQASGQSEGWLYAHLIESTIQYDVGDSVKAGDYLGDIVRWSEDWGHIHFARIKDKGNVWYYEDDEWGIVYNPLLSMQYRVDDIPPEIKKDFLQSKYAYSKNDNSGYLSPNKLKGEIDLIVQVSDYIGDAEWTIPAHETYYWIKNIPENNLIVARTLGQVLNHEYDFYASQWFKSYAGLIYKHDEDLLATGWMENVRDYYHILTNNNGDSTVSLMEMNLFFDTAEYPDGDYRLFVEVFDAYGNSALDSADIVFDNIPDIEPEEHVPANYKLMQNYPNPFNSGTTISFDLPEMSYVRIVIYDLTGKEVTTLGNKNYNYGSYSIPWDGMSHTGRQVSSGLYFYRLEAGSRNIVKKMLLIK